MPKQNPDPNLVAALVFEGAYGFEFQLACEVFGLHRPEMGEDWYRFAVCAETETVTTGDGRMRLMADMPLDELWRAGTIIVPGWPRDRKPTPALSAALTSAHVGGSRIATICSGAFLVSEIGLLNGRRATTHWRYDAEFRERFPEVKLTPDVLYIDEGDVLTSAGSAAGLDLLIHIVRKDKGAQAANSVARRLVLPAHREGGQQQFIETPIARTRHAGLSALLDQMRSDLSGDWSLHRMASACAMSERSFSRHFQSTTGLSPGNWLLQERLRAAKRLLEEGASNLDDLAEVVGLGSADNLKRRFVTHVGVTPATYRKTYRPTV